MHITQSSSSPCMLDARIVACAQVKDPSVDIPIGMIGATSIACVLYSLLALVLCAMVPVAQMDPAAPFASAFAALAMPSSGAWRAAFLGTSARFVSFGAFTGGVAAPVPHHWVSV